MIPLLLFSFTLVAVPLQGCLEITVYSDAVSGVQLVTPEPEEVEYVRTNVTVAAGGSVTLSCGSLLPHIFIWGFTKPGSDNNIAVAYNYGHGSKVQSTSEDLGQLSVPENSSSLRIDDVQDEAQGMFTCQALYDEEEGVRDTFYFIKLSVVEETP